MAKITEKEVDHVAALARLSLSPKEKAGYTKELEKILTYVGELQKVDTKKVEPTAHVTGLSNITRDDTVSPYTISGKELLSQAPAIEKGFLKVKAVLPE
jgi:aspartyl-tRNA(Asn)/glutamyl-tRNA(Gln) amidotransferase subunit C